jgi:hypothetical protein
LDLFILVSVLFVGLLAFGLVSGDPRILAKPIDPDRNVLSYSTDNACGVDEIVLDYPLIYFVTP